MVEVSLTLKEFYTGRILTTSTYYSQDYVDVGTAKVLNAPSYFDHLQFYFMNIRTEDDYCGVRKTHEFSEIINHSVRLTAWYVPKTFWECHGYSKVTVYTFLQTKDVFIDESPIDRVFSFHRVWIDPHTVLTTHRDGCTIYAKYRLVTIPDETFVRWLLSYEDFRPSPDSIAPWPYKCMQAIACYVKH